MLWHIIPQIVLQCIVYAADLGHVLRGYTIWQYFTSKDNMGQRESKLRTKAFLSLELN